MTINTSAPAISARAVRKSFGEHVVLDGVDLTVTEGTIFALLGPNGAGKTTMVRILSTLIAADAGDIQVGGHDVSGDPRAVRALIGVTGQFSAVDNLLTGEENLRLMADLRHLGRQAGRRRIAELLERFDLTAPRSTGFDVAEYQEQGDLAREGLALLADEPPERRAVLLEWAAFADFLVARLPELEKDWKAHREALRAAGELPDTPQHR